jgi:adenylate cyclase
MMFPQANGPNDSLLAEAIADKSVVVGYTLQFDGEGAASQPCLSGSLPLAIVGPDDSRISPLFQATGAVCSVPEIAAAAAGSGFLNASPDRDGVMRHVPTLAEYANRYIQASRWRL